MLTYMGFWAQVFNETPDTLFLWDNKLGDEGAKALAKAMEPIETKEDLSSFDQRYILGEWISWLLS